MKVETKQFRLKTSDWGFKTRAGGRRMKIYIKLNKEESAKWTSIKSAVLGVKEKMPNDQFAKIILFRGLNAFMEDIHTAIDEMDEAEKKKILEEAGVVPPDEEVDLEVPLIPKLEEKNENADDADAETGEGSESSVEEQEK